MPIQRLVAAEPSMPNGLGRVAALGWVVLAVLVGALLGAGAGFVDTAGVLAPWTRLPAPPQAGARLVAASPAYVVVAGAAGQLFVYGRAENTWSQLTPDQTSAYPNLALAGPPNPVMPASPGPALAVMYVVDPSQGSTVEYGAYALGQDGSVWAWFKTDSPTARRAGLQLALIGAAAGLLVGLAVLGARTLASRAPVS